MPLISISPDDTPADRLALYRQHGVTHTVLLLPWDSLSPLRQAAALQLASEWGRDLAGVNTARRDLAHAGPEEQELHLVDLWLVRLFVGGVHFLDVQYWMGALDRWKDGGEMEPRLRNYLDGWRQALPDHAPPTPPGPERPRRSCTRTNPKRRPGRR